MCVSHQAIRVSEQKTVTCMTELLAREIIVGLSDCKSSHNYNIFCIFQSVVYIEISKPTEENSELSSELSERRVSVGVRELDHPSSVCGVRQYVCLSLSGCVSYIIIIYTHSPYRPLCSSLHFCRVVVITHGFS